MSDPVALTEPKTVRLTLADHFAVVWRSPRVLITYWLVAAVLGLLLFGMDALTDDCGCTTWRDFPWDFVLMFGGFLSGVFLILTPILSHRRVKALLKGHGNIMQLLDKGVDCKLPGAEGITYWPTIKRFRRTDERLFLFIGKCSAFVIPKRDFDDPAEFERWGNIAESQLASIDKAS